MTTHAQSLPDFRRLIEQIRDIAHDVRVVAMRDYVAIVRSRGFLILVLAPILLGAGMIGMAALASTSARLLNQNAPVIIHTAPDRIEEIKQSPLYPSLSQLVTLEPDSGTTPQARRELAIKNRQSVIIDTGKDIIIQLRPGDNGFGARQFASIFFNHSPNQDQRAIILQSTRRASNDSPAPQQAPLLVILALFIVTSFLSLQSVGMLSEERTNRIVEVLVSSSSVPRIFMGKTIAQSMIAATFIVAWSVIFAGPLIALISIAAADKAQIVLANATPKIGWGWFLPLIAIQAWLTIALWNVVMMTLGSCMRSPRMIGILSAPANLIQSLGMALGIIASTSTGLLALLFVIPFTTLYGQVIRAYLSPSLITHFTAIGWLGLILVAAILIGSRVFARVAIDGWQGRK